MEIKNFKGESVRIGREYPVCLDVSLTDYGVEASFYHFNNELARVELRHKGSAYALFLSKYDDEALPEWWLDSQIVWELKTNKILEK